MVDIISLELLSAELQIQIMLQLDNIDALNALIRASPRLYQVFRLNKEHILSRVARRLFHPSVVLEALSIARLSQWGHPLSQERAMAFLQTPLKERKRRLFATTPISQSVSLCKLMKRISFFADDYTRNTLPLLSQVATSQGMPVATEHDAKTSKNTIRELSVSEIGRLQRAFCRYELYSQLFAQCSGGYKECKWHHRMIPAQEQTQLFLLKYRPFEIAEIHCIRDYLRRRLRRIYYQVEDEAVRTPQPEYFEQGDRCATGRKPCPWPFRYCGTSDQSGHLEHLMTLGLLYLRKIVEATGDERRDLILHGSDTCCGGISDRGFITEALEPLGLDRWGSGLIRAVNVQEELSSLSSHDDNMLIPSGWVWHYSDKKTMLPADGYARGLRKWGYVFWGHSRLKRLGILDRDPNEVERIKFEEDDRSRRLSVQERLMGPSDGIKAIRAAEMAEERSDGERSEDELSDEANETEKDWEARSYYLRKRL